MATAGNGILIAKNALKSAVEAGYFDRVLKHLQIVSVGMGKCVCELKVSKEHLNRGGSLHGGMTSMLVDSVSTMALMSTSKGVPGISVNMNITFIRAVKLGDEVLIEANTLKSGKTLAYLNVDIKNKTTGSLVAQGQHTKYVANPV